MSIAKLISAVLVCGVMLGASVANAGHLIPKHKYMYRGAGLTAAQQALRDRDASYHAGLPKTNDQLRKQQFAKDNMALAKKMRDGAGKKAK